MEKAALSVCGALACKRQLLTQLRQLLPAVRGSLGAQQAARHPAKKAGKDRFWASIFVTANYAVDEFTHTNIDSAVGIELSGQSCSEMQLENDKKTRHCPNGNG